MQVDRDFATTFDSDDEAREYGRAAKAVMLQPPEKCVEETRLLRDWVLAAELANGTDMETAQRRILLMYGVVAPQRILGAVLDHFGVLTEPQEVLSDRSDVELLKLAKRVEAQRAETQRLLTKQKLVQGFMGPCDLCGQPGQVEHG